MSHPLDLQRIFSLGSKLLIWSGITFGDVIILQALLPISSISFTFC